MKDSLGIPCDCECHSPGSGLHHIEECCDGQCPGCGKFFNRLRGHMADCPHYAIRYYKQARKDRIGKVTPNAQRYQVLP